MRTELTKRESEVIALVAKGLTDAEIADRIERSTRTVAMFISDAYKKINARNRVEATLWYLRETGRLK